jgi:hypothetical protein
MISTSRQVRMYVRQRAGRSGVTLTEISAVRTVYGRRNRSWPAVDTRTAWRNLIEANFHCSKNSFAYTDKEILIFKIH